MMVPFLFPCFFHFRLFFLRVIKWSDPRHRCGLLYLEEGCEPVRLRASTNFISIAWRAKLYLTLLDQLFRNEILGILLVKGR